MENVVVIDVMVPLDVVEVVVVAPVESVVEEVNVVVAP